MGTSGRLPRGEEKPATAKDLTYGAMMAALFGMLVLMNRQSAGMLEEFLLYAYPLPMTVYAANCGLKKSVPVYACTFFMALLFGTFSSFFYASSQSLVGMVLGVCLYKKMRPRKTRLITMGMMALADVLSGVVLASLFGVDLTQELTLIRDETEQMMVSLYGESEALSAALELLSMNFLLVLYIVVMVLLGILEGFVIYELGSIIVKLTRKYWTSL